MNKKTTVANSNSVGLIEDYYGVSSHGYGILNERRPKFDPNKALKVLENDPLVKGAIITLADKVLESGWRITGKDKKSRKKELEEKLKEIRFDPVLRKAIYNLILYNNAFIEIVKKEGELTDLNILETTFMQIDADDHGNVTGYTQNAMIGSTNRPHWNKDQVVHLKLRDITTNVWASPLDMQTLYETVLLKDYIRQWLTWFFGSNQLRGLYAIESGANDVKVKEFLSYLKASEKDKTKPLILQGKVVYQMLNSFSEGDKIIQLLSWCDTQILMLLQVPPIAVGQPDASGRSNSVEQFNALNTTVLSVQRILEESITYDLFKKIGFDKVLFDFGILDQTARLRAFEIAEKMKNMMFTDDAIIEFLESQGVVFETSEVFKDPVEEAQKMADVQMSMQPEVKKGSEGMVGKKPHDTAPSRQRQDANGNSIRSKANEKTLVRNSLDKFGGYPYEYN